jgi:hypothetical protein
MGSNLKGQEAQQAVHSTATGRAVTALARVMGISHEQESQPDEQAAYSTENGAVVSAANGGKPRGEPSHKNRYWMAGGRGQHGRAVFLGPCSSPAIPF